MITPPPLPKGYYFKLTPGYSEYADFMLARLQNYAASVKLYKKGLWGNSKHVVTISIPETGPHVHPTEEQVLEAMKTAMLYVPTN